VTAEACSDRDPATCDDGSVSAVEHRQERSWHGVRCSGRALECPELRHRRLAGCRRDRNTRGCDEGRESEPPHPLGSLPGHRGSMTDDCKAVRPASGSWPGPVFRNDP
jgi:hypothetical protein